MFNRMFVVAVVLLLSTPAIGADAVVGERPYEMVWANRVQDTRPPLIDFEVEQDWKVETQRAVATFQRSRTQQLFGDYVGQLTYRADGTGPSVRVSLETPVTAPDNFDCVNLWVYGNNWAWSPDPSTPQVNVAVILRTREGREVSIPMGNVRWKEWWLMHRRLTEEQQELLRDGASAVGFQVSGGRNKDDRTLFFDNLCCYREELPPLTFEPRPLRGITPFPGQTTGTNTGPGKLPFPTREETILPDNLTEDFQNEVVEADGAFEFHYRGSDGHLVYRYRPSKGCLSDVTAKWGDSGDFQPLAEGGVFFADGASDVAPATDPKLIECKRSQQAVQSRWKTERNGESVEYAFTLRLWQKSLVVDVRCVGGHVGEVQVGKAVGVQNPRVVTFPYLTGGAQRPGVLVTGAEEQPLFTSAFVDHCRSNGSLLWAVNEVKENTATYNGGSRYLPKTNGQRNDCFERLFLTISPHVEEVLPNIPNPKSPWMKVTGERSWRAHGASNREHDYAFWENIACYGMTKTVITDHETGWRDGGESFTFRTRAAPGRGGDASQTEYSKKLQDLGFRYGIYNNYTDFAPVNEHWSEDMVTRLSDGEWRTAWARCYNPKPARAVEYEAKLAPIIQQKFHLSTAYCDVHTAVTPWQYCDFDARVPGAGTFAATFYAYGEIMLHQKRTWNGPVYSEGNNHWYYCGLTDGNYGQDQRADLDKKPWLVDFDLRKLHPLCCNFGMGNLGMFFGRHQGLGKTPEEQERRLDQFLAATLAFGHTGFLVREGGIANTVRSYFTLQQLHARYATALAQDIRYADSQGRLLTSSAAIATGAYQRSQIVTRYSNGLEVTVNGHPTESWKTTDAELPPFGWYVRDTKSNDLLGFSAMVDGHRADYVDSPAYVYADGRGVFTRFEKAACDGQLIAHRYDDGTLELIPLDNCKSFGISLAGRDASVVALDRERKGLGAAETRLSRGLVYVTPVPNAFSYRLTPTEPSAVTLSCARTDVVPGETLAVHGTESHSLQIPSDAIPGTLIWRQLEGGWIDFHIVPLVVAELQLDSSLQLTLKSNAASPMDADLQLGKHSRSVRLVPGEEVCVEFPFERPHHETVIVLPMKVNAGHLSYTQQWWLKAEEAIQHISDLPATFRSGECLRGQDERAFAGDSGGHVNRQAMSCGDVSYAGVFMHPPYKKGVGYSFAEFGPIDLPSSPAAAFRCRIGKRDGSDSGDGILFRVAVVDKAGRESILAEKQWIKHAWTSLEGDLSRWAGESVRIKLISDVGPKDNSSGDWACWSDMRIESRRPVLIGSLYPHAVELQFAPGPSPCEGLSAERLKRAKSGRLHFQGIGLQSSGRYVSDAALNGISLGRLPSAGGVESQGTWSDASVALTPEAISMLDPSNTFEISNPGQDCFKVRHVWLELEFDDSSRCSSKITTPVFTQPPEWLHAEGNRVPFGENIRVEIRFPTAAP